jgi:hypothetical protein
VTLWLLAHVDLFFAVMSGPLVLKIVVESSVLDLRMINDTIRSLSKEFQTIRDNAMVEHTSFREALN